MCRYGCKIYKSHFACFNCRKTFKQAHYADLLKRVGKADYYEKISRKTVKQLSDKEAALIEDVIDNYKYREIKCPQCGGYMADLGLDFKSPKMTAVKEWDIIKGFYAIGRSFYSCGCDGIGYIPQTPKDYVEYLKKMLHEYEASILQCQKITIQERHDKARLIKYWSDKAGAVKEELAKCKQ